MSGPVSGDVVRAASRLGFDLTEEQAEKLASYLDQLVRWNKRMNLVGHSRWQEVFDDLVADSLHLSRFMATLPLPQAPLTLDFGAGAGLPGIPLRVLWTPGDYRLVEVRLKRTGFMRSALARTGITGTSVMDCRAENALEEIAAKGGPNVADVILSRAFMPPETLLPFVQPMLRPESGLLVLMVNEAQTVPAGWESVAEATYKAGKTFRRFEALKPRS